MKHFWLIVCSFLVCTGFAQTKKELRWLQKAINKYGERDLTDVIEEPDLKSWSIIRQLIRAKIKVEMHDSLVSSKACLTELSLADSSFLNYEGCVTYTFSINDLIEIVALNPHDLNKRSLQLTTREDKIIETVDTAVDRVRYRSELELYLNWNAKEGLFKETYDILKKLCDINSRISP